MLWANFEVAPSIRHWTVTLECAGDGIEIRYTASAGQ